MCSSVVVLGVVLIPSEKDGDGEWRYDIIRWRGNQGYAARFIA
jgi:hypothetical protein